MAAGTVAGVLVFVALAALLVVPAVVARRRSAGREVGRPDEVSEEVVAGLLAELRKWQAEAAYWKRTAERLQRDLDDRQ